MQLFVIYFSTLTFLLIELIGLLKGEPVGSILFKSLGAFVVLFSLGTLLSKSLGQIKKKEEGEQPQKPAAAGTQGSTLKDVVGAPTLAQAPEASASSQDEAYKQEAIRLAREKPKEVAQMFEVLINK